MKQKFVRSMIICTVVLASFVFVQQGLATVIESPISMSGMVMGHPELGTFNWEPEWQEFEQEDGGKKWKLKDPVLHEGVWMGSADIQVDEIEFDPDPIVYNNFLVSNTSGSNQTYQITVTLPTTWGAPNQIRGSIDTSVIGPNALLQAPSGGSIYSALIDGASVETLQDDTFALGTGQDATSASASFGWDPSAVAVASSIGIQLTFTLSDGATAAIISDFEVIPEPASAAMISLTTLGIFFIRRRFID